MRDFAHRPIPARALACALFALAVLAFSMPFVTVVADRRSGEGTGFELAARTPKFTGIYVHESYRGEAELWTHRGETPALLALVALVAALALVWIPWRAGPTAASTFGALALIAFYGFFQRVGSIDAFAVTDRRFGFGFALVFTLAATAWSVFLLTQTPFWREPDLASRRDYFA